MNYLLWALFIVGAARFAGWVWRQHTRDPQIRTHALQMFFGAWAGWFLFWGA